MIHDGTWHMPDDEEPDGQGEATLTINGQEQTIPVSLAQELSRALKASGGVRVQAADSLISIHEATELLGVSRTKVLELIAQGELRGQAQAVGSSSVQRVRFASVIRLIERQVDVRHAALDELTRLSQELGAYE